MPENNELRKFDNQINLTYIFRSIREFKEIFLIITATFSIISLIVALSLPDKYKSVLVLAPSEVEKGSLSEQFGQLNSISLLSGLGVGNLTGSNVFAYEIMRSWKFVEDFVEDNNLQTELYTTTGWNEDTNTLIIDEDLFDTEKQQWLIKSEDGSLRGPTSWELYNRFLELLIITSDPNTGLISISLEFYSPHKAKEWLDLYYLAINKHMQSRKLDRVNSNIQYLSDQIDKSPISGMREIFFSIIEDQIKSKMLTEATPEHTFVIVNPSMTPQERSSPRRWLIFILGTISGVVLSLLVVSFLVLSNWNNISKDRL